jgi:glycerophosphoryl diester phosphodiesterase
MRRPLLLGHRGARASRGIPENTLASFELCLQHGCDGFEFDVRRSADGQAVICHDATSGGIKIAASPAKSLGLPTLGQVLQQFSSRAFLDIELKVAGLEAQTLAALRAFPPKKGYVVSSFLTDVLKALHDLDASVPLGLLCEKRSQFTMESRTCRPAGRAETPVPPSELLMTWVILRLNLVDHALVDDLHSAGKEVLVWTVNRADEFRRMAEWGVDAIISDETEVAVQALPIR